MCNKRTKAERADYLDAIALAVSISLTALESERMLGESQWLEPEGADSLDNLRQVIRGLGETADTWREGVVNA